MRKRRKLIIAITALAGLCLLLVFYCDRKVKATARGKMFSDVNEVPYHHVGILLGTGKYLKSGRINPYYSYRIDATQRLMQAGKIDYLVISGDNSRKDYSEPEMMRADLMAVGIDSARIFLDYAGFRTFDSMVRLREIFSQDTVTVISQRFHNERALFIARREGITAVGFNARDISSSAGWRTRLREKLARVKVFADYIFHTKPKYLGPKVQIP